MWTETYRPTSLDDLSLPSDVRRKLVYIRDTQASHVAMFGPVGIGKTSAACALIREWFPDVNDRARMTMEVNASNDSGVDFMRNEVLPFMEKSCRSGLLGLTQYRLKKVLLLDEADCLSKEAQACLRVPLEKYESHTLVIFTGNTQSNIIPALLSRCTRVSFPRPTWINVVKILEGIALKEKLNPSTEFWSYLQRECEHLQDFREPIKLFQFHGALCEGKEETSFLPSNVPDVSILFNDGEQAIEEKAQQACDLGYQGCAWTREILYHLLENKCKVDKLYFTVQTHSLIASGAHPPSCIASLLQVIL